MQKGTQHDRNADHQINRFNVEEEKENFNQINRTPMMQRQNTAPNQHFGIAQKTEEHKKSD